MARKYNVTSTIKEVKTVYKKYNTFTDEVETITSLNVPTYTTHTLQEQLKELRKVDFEACKPVSQSSIEKKYGMTDETFMTLAFPVSKTKRHGLVTRDKKNTVVDLQMFDMTNNKMFGCKEVIVPADIAKKSKAKIEAYIRETKETAKIKVLTIGNLYDKTDENMVYALTKDVFITNAVEIDDKGNEVKHE